MLSDRLWWSVLIAIPVLPPLIAGAVLWCFLHRRYFHLDDQLKCWHACIKGATAWTAVMGALLGAAKLINQHQQQAIAAADQKQREIVQYHERLLEAATQEQREMQFAEQQQQRDSALATADSLRKDRDFATERLREKRVILDELVEVAYDMKDNLHGEVDGALSRRFDILYLKALTGLVEPDGDAADALLAFKLLLRDPDAKSTTIDDAHNKLFEECAKEIAADMAKVHELDLEISSLLAFRVQAEDSNVK